MRAQRMILYEGDLPPRVVFQTSDGCRYSPEQWQVMQFMARLEKKVDRLLAALSATNQ